MKKEKNARSDEQLDDFLKNTFQKNGVNIVKQIEQIAEQNPEKIALVELWLLSIKINIKQSQLIR